jgi:adenylosuccinate synthase
MNKNIKIVIGANYGDEGKGLMTNYYCQSFPKSSNVINIRYNGGAQAGHTVVFDDITRVVFSHFGSGSLNNNVTTLLGEKFILNPMLFKVEWNKIISNGNNIKVPYIYKNGLVTFPMDMMINQFVENSRGENRHGSCGVGINETIEKYSVNINPTIFVKDFIEKSDIEIFETIKNNVSLWKYYINRLVELNLNLSEEQKELFYNDNILKTFSSDFRFMLDHSIIYEDIEEILKDYGYIVFEGAQGLLLDMDNGVNTTPSHTGLEYLIPFLTQNIKNNVEICYVTRTYFTRHGAGEFLTECDKSYINKDMQDETNITNEFQESFRYGYFNVMDFELALKKQHGLCKKIKSCGNLVSEVICITHINETNSRIVFPNRSVGINTFSNLINKTIGYTSNKDGFVNKLGEKI